MSALRLDDWFARLFSKISTATWRPAVRRWFRGTRPWPNETPASSARENLPEVNQPTAVEQPRAVAAYPEGILYSPLSSCNLNCVQCISRHTRTRARRMAPAIKAELVQLVADRHLRWMFTDYSGDILFADHKNPGELDFVLNLGIAIHIDTNGAYLDDERIEKILASRVDTVSISIDAATDQTYQTIRIGAPHLDRIFETAHKLVQARERHGRRNSFNIRLGYTLMRSNIDELPLFVRRAAEAGVDAIGCRHLEVYHPTMEAESLFHDKARFNRLRAESLKTAAECGIALLMGDELHDAPRTGSDRPCTIAWNSTVLLANGDVMACCVPGSKMGNLHEQALHDIWHGPAYRRLRETVNSPCPPSLCRSCQFRRTLEDFDDVAEITASMHARPLLDDLLGTDRPAVT